MPTKPLLRASALYKNDTQNGIGIILINTTGDLEEILITGIENYEKAWDEADDDMRKKYVSGYFQQLDYFSQFRMEDRDYEQNITCFWNIFFLEKYGFLKADNFNGCAFLYDAK